MPKPLDSVLRSYDVLGEAMETVRRSLTLPTARGTLLQGPPFAGLTDVDLLELLDQSQKDLDEQTVLFLYAAFEAALRDHVAAQAGLLAAAVRPTPQFGLDLQAWYERLCQDARMDGVADLFASALPPGLPAAVGTIRKYRHWLAHRRRGRAPPSVSPQFVYASLTGFLQACGLT